MRGGPGAFPFALALLLSRVLPGSLGFGLVTVGLAFLAGLVLGVPLPLLFLTLAPLLLLEVMLRLPLVLLSTGRRISPGDTSGTRWGPNGGPVPASRTLKASRRWYSSLAISSATQAGMSGMATSMTYFRNRAKCCRGTRGSG